MISENHFATLKDLKDVHNSVYSRSAVQSLGRLLDAIAMYKRCRDDELLSLNAQDVLLASLEQAIIEFSFTNYDYPTRVEASNTTEYGRIDAMLNTEGVGTVKYKDQEFVLINKDEVYVNRSNVKEFLDSIVDCMKDD